MPAAAGAGTTDVPFGRARHCSSGDIRCVRSVRAGVAGNADSAAHANMRELGQEPSALAGVIAPGTALRTSSGARACQRLSTPI
jgi:hypothetical protein